MKLSSSLFPAVLLAAACAFAQQPGTTTAPSATPDSTQSAPAAQPQTDANSTTIRGCLGSGADNTYTVTEEKTGTVYTLAGKDFSSLSSHVGQEVEADGQPSAGTASAASAPATDSAAAAPSN